jgi:hypothetical protein
MPDTPIEPQRRALLQSAAGLAMAGLPATKAAAAAPPGKPGDFDFLAGQWTISHRRLKKAGSDDWDVFKGEATCWTILAGAGSVEELRIPARGFSGMGLRLLDLEQRVWNDFWVNGKSGVLSTPGMTGSFDQGVGTFTAEEKDGDRPILVRGVWDRITPGSCRWHQASSVDGGKTWAPDWFMDWVRA